MIKLSVVIITLNEERNIRDCIESVLEVADEIVVVDSFSTDNTEKICNEFNVKFIKNPFKGYIEQKNFAAGKAFHEYILSLDADERLDQELAREIKKVKINPEFDAYKFNRLSYYCGRWIHHSGWYPDEKLRLWKRGEGEWGGRNPHDKFIMFKATQVKHLKGNLLHYSFRSLEEQQVQTNKFSTIAAEMMFSEGKRASLVKLIFSPTIKFIRDYLINLGFLDGFAGLTICKTSAYATYLKYAKLRELHRKSLNTESNN